MVHGADIIIVRKDGAVLLQHRDNKPGIFYPDYWGYPAVSVDEGKDFISAAKRELFEETGYRAGAPQDLKCETYIRTDGETVQRHIYWTRYDEKQIIKCYEGMEMRFLKPQEFKGKKFLPDQKRLLLLAIKRAKQE